MYMYMCLCMYVCMYVHMCMYMYMNNMFMREQHTSQNQTQTTPTVILRVFRVRALVLGPVARSLLGVRSGKSLT